MSDEQTQAIERAAYLLRAVERFIETNPISDYTVLYDGAQCDGSCLSDDCLIAAGELEALFGRTQ